MVTHTLVEKTLIALFSSISYQNLRKRWETFETLWALREKNCNIYSTCLKIKILKICIPDLILKRDSFIIPHLKCAFLVSIFLLVQKLCCLFLLDSVTSYDSSISLLECKMQIFRKIRHFIYANNGKPTRPWKKVLVKVTSMHLTFDQEGFFSRADEVRGKKYMNANELAICRPILLPGCVPLLDYNITL